MPSNSRNPKNKPVKKPVRKTVDNPLSEKTKTKPSVVERTTLLNNLDGFFIKHMNAVLVISIMLTVILGALLFDVKISTGGDDSNYIEMADEFLKGKALPSWHGPLYSIFLSLPILIFGVNIIWLKIVSFIFILAHQVLFFYTFRKHVSATLLTLVMLIVSVSSSILYFASQTYSEAMFMFLQSLVVFLFINIYLNINNTTHLPLKREALQWLILGFFVFLMSIARNVGIVVLLAIVLFLVMEKRFRGAIMLAGSYTSFTVLFRIYKSVVWNISFTEKPAQMTVILQKDFYNKAAGTEDFAGMVDRFLINANSYLSKHFMTGIGLHDPSSTEKSALVTIIITILFLIAAYVAFRRSNKVMFFVSIYLGGAIAATFIALQTAWDQMRLIAIYIPMLLLLLTWGIRQISEDKRYTYIGFGFLIFLGVIFFRTFDQTVDKIKVNRKILSRNIKGNLYYGFTPDWQNFLRMSEWVGKNIPPGKMIASRKPSMSYVYSKGRDFYGIQRFPAQPTEEFITRLKRRTGELSVFPNRAVRPDWPASLQWDIKRANVAWVAEGSEIYGVYDFKKEQGNEILQALYGYNVTPFSTDSLLNRISKSKESSFAVSPDSLINTLYRNNVEYVIVASLRVNPNVKTGNVINTIQRYLYFVELKYPGILNFVHQVGADADEPAWLYQIDYDKFGL